MIADEVYDNIAKCSEGRVHASTAKDAFVHILDHVELRTVEDCADEQSGVALVALLEFQTEHPIEYGYEGNCALARVYPALDGIELISIDDELYNDVESNIRKILDPRHHDAELSIFKNYRK